MLKRILKYPRGLLLRAVRLDYASRDDSVMRRFEKRKKNLRHRDSGFTLMEMLIVIALLSLVLVSVPPMFAWMERQGVRLAVDQLRADLQLARIMAINRRQRCCVAINSPGPAQYTNLLNGRTVDLSSYRGGVHFVERIPDGGRSTKQINFTRRGMACPAGSIYLADRGQTQLYCLRILTPGSISVFQWTSNGWR